MQHPTHALTKVLLVLDIVGRLCSASVPNGSNLEHLTKEKNALEARKKKDQQDMMTRIMPFMMIPFVISTTIMPMVMMSLKMMLIKSAFIGKMAILLLLLNLLRPRGQGQGGVYEHNVPVKDMMMGHYGYGGGEEYGAYIN